MCCNQLPTVPTATHQASLHLTRKLLRGLPVADACCMRSACAAFLGTSITDAASSCGAGMPTRSAGLLASVLLAGCCEETACLLLGWNLDTARAPLRLLHAAALLCEEQHGGLQVACSEQRATVASQGRPGGYSKQQYYSIAYPPALPPRHATAVADAGERCCCKPRPRPAVSERFAVAAVSVVACADGLLLARRGCSKAYFSCALHTSSPRKCICARSCCSV